MEVVVNKRGAFGARLGILPSPPMSPSITICTYCALHEVLPKLERAFSICALIYGVSSIYEVNLVVCHIAGFAPPCSSTPLDHALGCRQASPLSWSCKVRLFYQPFRQRLIAILVSVTVSALLPIPFKLMLYTTRCLRA